MSPLGPTFGSSILHELISPKTEIANQLAVLKHLFPARASSSIAAYLIMMLFLPPWLCILLYFTDMGIEMLGFRPLKDLDPIQDPKRLYAAMATIVLGELTYCTPAVMIWQIEDQFAKSLAVGLICLTTFQISSARSVYLLFGILTLGTATVTTLVGNTYYWVTHQDGAGFAITTVGILAAAYYAASSMMSTHYLHRQNSQRGEEANAASLAKGQFIAQISHELRTPLNAIIGMGAAERAQASTAASISRMNLLIDSATGLAVILDDILDYSALDSKGVTLRKEPFDPAELIENTIALFRPQFDNAGLALELNGATELPDCLMIDPLRLRQCLSNLLSNALKFTAKGAVTVSVSMKDAQLVIDVQDTGRGISAAESQQLFQPFHRGSADQHGTGLGLAISRGLARKMGGDLTLQSSKSGALFRLTVGAPAGTRPPMPPQKSLRFEGLRVLVVDDIATNRLVAIAYLRHLGALTQEAENGVQALSMVAEAPPDVVFLDIHMPQMNGVDCLKAMRKLTEHHLPIIAMTADASMTQRTEYMASGLDGYLAKPLSLESVQAVLQPHAPAAMQ